MTAAEAMTGAAPRVAVLADDLIWGTRLVDAIQKAGATPRRTRRLEDLAGQVSGGTPFVIVDLTALAYDGIEAVRQSADAGARVLAVGQHDDIDLRRRALDAGAERVFAYWKLFEAGPATIAGWLAAAPTKPPAAKTSAR